MADQHDSLERILQALSASPEQIDTFQKSIRAWRQAESALQDSEARNRAVLETTVDGIITTDASGIVQSFNPAAERIFGYTAAEAIGQNVSKLMTAPDRKQHDRYISNYLRTGEERVIGIGREVAGQRKDGTVFPLDLAMNEATVGEERLFTGIVRDITERKRVEQALDDERSFVSAVLDTAGVLVMVLAKDGSIVRFNNAIEKTTGYAADEAIGHIFWDLMIPEDDRDAARKRFRNQVAGTLTDHGEYDCETFSGEIRHIAWSHADIRDADGNVEFIIETGTDVTERKQADLALVAVSEEVRRLIGQELHDALGQQLTGISLLARALDKKLQDGVRGDPKEAAEITSLAMGAVQEVKRLAHGLYPTDLDRLGLQAVLGELARSLSRMYGVECAYQGEESTIELDERTALHLYRIAQEATTNSVKHGRPQQVAIDLFRENDAIHLLVRDDGDGISGTIGPGRGMGLKIMQHRANMVGARLDIESTPGEGVIVRCVLPERGHGRPHRTEDEL